MANYTKNYPGAPDAGLYAIGDTVKDSTGVTWTCIAAGQPGNWVGSFFNAPNFTALAATATVKDQGFGAFHFTTITLADFLTTVTDASAFGGSKIFTFPEGRIYIIGCIATLQYGANGVRASTINNSSTVDWALGTVTASNVVLAGTMINIAPLVDEAVVGDDALYGTASSSVLAAAAFFDGTTTAVDLFLNSAFSDNTDIDADGVLKTQGTIALTWVHLGDK